jgi:serine O-acetyltransferase
MRKIRSVLQMIRLFTILPWVNWKDDKFIKDLNRWKDICCLDGSKTAVFARLLWDKKEFRNLYIYRNSHRRIFRYWIAFWYRPMDTLFIETPEIGGGLYIQHGFATMIAAKSIGENCWINQQVSIGYAGKGCPVIGSNVMITCGAKVLGDITVGDGAVIGANAVVVRDVEPGAVMGGIPAKVIRRREG